MPPTAPPSVAPRRIVKMAAVQLAAPLAPQSLSENGDLRVAWATENYLLPKTIPADDYSYQKALVRFSFDPKHIRTERLNRGLHVLHEHGYSGLQNALLGRSVDWKIEGREPNRQMVSTVRFTKRKDDAAQGVVTDIRDGILGSLSFGAWLHELQPTQEAEDGLPIYLAVDWEPFEITFTVNPRNPEAATMSNDISTVECIVLGSAASSAGNGGPQSGSNAMPPNGNGDPSAPSNVATASNAPATTSAPAPGSVIAPAAVPSPAPAATASSTNADVLLAAARAEAQNAERGRCVAIGALCSKHRIDEETTEQLLSSGASIERARESVLDRLHARSASVPASAASHAGQVAGDGTSAAAEAAILLSLNAPVVNDAERKQREDLGRRFRGLRMVELARRVLQAKGVQVDGLSGYEIARLAVSPMSTSDFPKILQNIQSKYLQLGYDGAPSTFQLFARERTAVDFKTMGTVHLGLGPKMTQLLAGEPIRYGKFSEGGETYAVKRYGTGIQFSIEAMVNDDLSALSDIPRAFGTETRMLINRLAWALITSNVVMADGTALFAAGHANDLSPDTALGATGLSGLRKLLRLQTDPDGKVLNLTPKTLVVGPSLETTGKQLVSSQIWPAAAGNVNTFVGTEIVVEQELEAAGVSGATTRYLMAADPALVAGFEIAYLEGNRTPRIQSEMDFDTSAMKTKAEFEVGLCVPNHRAWVRSNGTS